MFGVYFKKIGFLCVFIFYNLLIHAQSKSNQLWTDFTVNKPLANRFTFDCEVSYRTTLKNSEKWHSFSFIPKIEKAVGNHWDILFYLASINTLQQTSDNTWEIRPAVGARYRFSLLRKLQVRLLARLEFRNQYTLETSIWSNDFRSRFRVEETYFLNGESYAENHLWYLLSDVEFLLTIDKEIQERFSNRMLLRLGLGYKLSDRWRFESFYTYQYAVNTINGEFSNEDEDIIRLRFRYYFD
jgi:Protein of unknown function (DUF2490)